MSRNPLQAMIEQVVDQRVDQRFAELLSLGFDTEKPPRPSAARWTEEDKRQVVQDALSGMSMEQMARKYGRTVGAIRLRLYGKKAGLLHKSHLNNIWRETS